jgi:hypothetical protein
MRSVKDFFRFSTSLWTEKKFFEDWRFLKCDTVFFPKTQTVRLFFRQSVNLYLTARRYFTNGFNFRSNRLENLKSRMEDFIFVENNF